MLTDALLAWLHYILIIALAGCIVAELALYRPTLERGVFERLGRIDGWYGIIAALVVGSGVLRVLYSPKGAAFYLHNPIFWTKMSLFLIVGLLSIPPTIHYIRTRSSAGDAATITVARATYVRMRALLVVEAAVFIAIPLCAALMARGFGLSE